jgi:hypothetical protein
MPVNRRLRRRRFNDHHPAILASGWVDLPLLMADKDINSAIKAFRSSEATIGLTALIMIPFNYMEFQFEPWLPGNNLGPKTWIAIALPVQSKVILKLWDAWKFDQDARDREASVYLRLRSLWGEYIPSLFVKSALEYFHALIFQYIRVPCSQHAF